VPPPPVNILVQQHGESDFVTQQSIYWLLGLVMQEMKISPPGISALLAFDALLTEIIVTRIINASVD
jgi:hypothetical protein